MNLDILVKFLEKGVECAKTHALTAATLKQTRTVDDKLSSVKTDDLMTFDVGAYSEGVQPGEAAVLVAAMRAAHVPAAQIAKAIDASSLAGYYQQMLHTANGA